MATMRPPSPKSLVKSLQRINVSINSDLAKLPRADISVVIPSSFEEKINDDHISIQGRNNKSMISQVAVQKPKLPPKAPTVAAKKLNKAKTSSSFITTGGNDSESLMYNSIFENRSDFALLKTQASSKDQGTSEGNGNFIDSRVEEDPAVYSTVSTKGQSLQSITSSLNENFIDPTSLFDNSMTSAAVSFNNSQLSHVLSKKLKSKSKKSRFALIEKRFGTTKHVHQPTRTQKQLLHDLTPKWQRPVVRNSSKTKIRKK